MASVAQGRPPSRSLASPAIRELVGRRMAELSGVGMAMAGIALLVALATYNPRDPSFNTATSQHATNLAGPAGSIVADFLLQGFGAAAILPGVAMLAWAWRIASRRGLGHPVWRAIAIFLAVPSLALALSMVSPGLAWPTDAGLGGAGGHLLSVTSLDLARGKLGPMGTVLVFVAALALAIVLSAASFGLTRREWRVAGRGAVVAAKVGSTGSQSVVGILGRAGGAIAKRKRAEPAAAPQPAPYVPQAFVSSSAVPPPAITPVVRRTGEPAAPLPLPPKTVVKARVAAMERKPATNWQDSLPLGETGWQLPPHSILKGAAVARRHRAGRGGAAEQCPPAGIGPVGLRRAGRDTRHPPGPCGHPL